MLGTVESCGESLCLMYSFCFSSLDQENVHSVLSSEHKVEQLMLKLDEGITEAERVEAKLDSYDEILCHIRDTMEKMEEKNLMIEIVNKNNQKLLLELEKVIVSFSKIHLGAR